MNKMNLKLSFLNTMKQWNMVTEQLNIVKRVPGATKKELLLTKTQTK